jgi:hypothetical protein
MASEQWELTPRKPRYPSTGRKAVRAEIERSPGRTPGVVSADLQDLSRNGFQVRTPIPLQSGEAIRVRIEIEQPALSLTVPGTVRWQRADEGAWVAGCLSDRPIDWESLGELFLNDILDTDGT